MAKTCLRWGSRQSMVAAFRPTCNFTAILSRDLSFEDCEKKNVYSSGISMWGQFINVNLLLYNCAWLKCFHPKVPQPHSWSAIFGSETGARDSLENLISPYDFLSFIVVGKPFRATWNRKEASRSPSWKTYQDARRAFNLCCKSFSIHSTAGIAKLHWGKIVQFIFRCSTSK